MQNRTNFARFWTIENRFRIEKNFNGSPNKEF